MSANNIPYVHLRCINPILPLVFGEELSYLECIAKLRKKVNELIDKINSIDIDKVEDEIADVRRELLELQVSVNAQLLETLNKVDSKLNVNTKWTQDYVETEINALRLEVERAQKLYVVDPVTGGMVTFEEALYSLFGLHRDNALTAAEYDSKQLTASAYDALQITAIHYDLNGKSYIQ